MKFSYLVLSDVHLGNKRNTTTEIISNLDQYFENYSVHSRFSKINIIFIAGDLFDTLLDAADDDVQEINLWLGRLMRFCMRFNIKLRILEGTPSHDWKQSKAAVTVFSLLEKEIDFRYISTLHIEHMQDLGIHVLYVPDEWTASTDLTLLQAKELMQEMGISQVDIAIMHGAFPHQLPPAAANSPKHDTAAYLSMVRYFISIGHIHTFSVLERIIAQGSFDRLSHGEEEAKGAVLCHIDDKVGNSFEFIENKGAKIFKTIELKFPDLDRSLVQVQKVLSKIKDNSYVRIMANKNHPLYIAFEELKDRYPMYVFTKTSKEDELEKERAIQNSAVLDEQYSAITINRENIVSLIMHEVKTKHNLNPEKLFLLNNQLEKLNT